MQDFVHQQYEGFGAKPMSTKLLNKETAEVPQLFLGHSSAKANRQRIRLGLSQYLKGPKYLYSRMSGFYMRNY